MTAGERNYKFPVPEATSDGLGYFALNGRDSKNAFVLLAEWWGLNQAIMETAETFAKKGFAVLVVDVYRGKSSDSRETAGHLKQGLDFNGACNDIRAAARDLKAKGYEKVGVTGFCMGGALAIAAVTNGADEFTCCAPFYGVPDLAKYDIKTVKVPVLAHFGSLDDKPGFSDPETAYKLEALAKEGGVNFTLKMWEGVNHAFMNRARADAYNPEIAEAALKMTIDFFNSI